MNTKKVVLSECAINQVAHAIATADIVARAPKERNPAISMEKTPSFFRALEMAKLGVKIKLV